MQAIRPNGDEMLATGTKEEMEKLAHRERDEFGSDAKVFGPGESFRMKDGRKATVTAHGLKLEVERKKKVCNRKKNKAAREARRKSRR